jgi:hypothetical protein
MSAPGDALRESDPAVVARYLQLRGHFLDRILTRVESHIPDRYRVQPTQRLHASVSCLMRNGFLRPGEGELWPVVFLSAVDITLALCVQIAPERLAAMGTMLRGPSRLRHRHWEDWFGWETTLGGTHPQFFKLGTADQDNAMLAWYAGNLEWLANGGLLARRS